MRSASEWDRATVSVYGDDILTIEDVSADGATFICPVCHEEIDGKHIEQVSNDKLTQIFTMQKTLDGRITSERGIKKSLDEWVIGITLAMESEIDEIRREVNWKWWKNPKPIDRDALRGEVIDMWHFLVSLSDKVGLSAEDVHRIYVEKNAENHARQDGTSAKEGYAV
ncbi:dUTPase [Paenibacillus sp. HWE-109]|uniref:dUTPase n=1 Tax=Paenibacillus sp. HWE-109 TaxID=1306526 RepID=UPI001EDE0516|nr:dUTPase [Paenibacillus sp. HWE-109]UKS30188.1 dUTPase [Paenibacillus sp. HWE-109]